MGIILLKIIIDKDSKKYYIVATSNGKQFTEKWKTMENVIQVTIELRGNEASQFAEYKAAQFLRSNAEAARKLMLERLSQIKKEEKAVV